MATDAAISRWRRGGYAALSGLSGWLVGQVACLPVNLIVAVRDTEGQPKLFVETLLYGLVAWGAWTLLLATAAWVLVVLPLVMTMRPCLVVRLRFVLPIAATVGGLSLIATRPTMFRDRSAIRRVVHAGDGVDVHPAVQTAPGSCRVRGATSGILD